MPADQMALYKRVFQSFFKGLESAEGRAKRQGAVWKLQHALIKVCNHPGLFEKSDKPFASAPSGKTAYLVDLLRDIFDRGEKALIFTPHTTTQKMLADVLLQELDVEALTFNGELTQQKRQEYCAKFKLPTYRVMILTLGSGAVGLNLIEANNVVHYDRGWNPQMERQAEDRVHRIGQTRDVNVYQLLSDGTFEERIDEVLRRKRRLADDFLDVETTNISHLSNQELCDLFTLERPTFF
jgi:SNF2 family DNA or RNA helicase